VTTHVRLLIVEDRPEDAELLVAALVRAGFSPDWSRVDTPDSLRRALVNPPTLILCDYSLPGLDALGVLSMLQEMAIDVPLIVVSGQMDEETCVKSLRMGAVDYLLKDRLVRLGPAVEHALQTRRLRLEKRDAERKEHRATSILQGLVAHAPAAISVKSVDGRYLLANRQFETLCRVAPGSLVGKIDADVFGVERAREMTDLDARCLHNQIVVEREEDFGDRNLLCVRYPVTDEVGAVSGIGSIYLDITRQKRIETELRDARTQLLTRAEELGEDNQHLREEERIKNEFVASVSHELRTPLTSIRGYLEMLGDPDTPIDGEMGRRFLGIIDRNSEHLLSLIEDLLILSQMDAGTAPALDQSVSVPDIVAAAVDMLRPAAERAGLTLSVQVEAGLPMVTGRRDQLERAVINLVSNAVKFSRPAGTVTVEAVRAGGAIRLSVTDQGIGISVEDQHRLFTRFFRTGAVRDRGIPGTGLGLAVVKGIVEAHGGTVGLESEPGVGTTFTLTFPQVS
jgi:signal transduction histidine kinase/FixJ family two-component response regulator